MKYITEKYINVFNDIFEEHLAQTILLSIAIKHIYLLYNILVIVLSIYINLNLVNSHILI